MPSRPTAPRSMRAPAAIGALFVIVVGALLAGRDREAVRQISIVFTGSLFGVVAVLAFVRGREAPDERAGWFLIALSHALLTLAGVVALVLPVSRVPAPGAFTLPIVNNVLVAAGLWVWPWHLDHPVRRFANVLGSALFIGSIWLLLWLSGTWSAGLLGDPFTRLTLVGFAIHVVLVGGMGLYLVSQAPRRVRGPLGWILAGTVASAFVLGLLQVFVTGGGTWGPLFAALTMGPIGYILAAWCRRPVEPPVAGELSPRWSALLYAPYAIVGGTLAWAVLARHEHLVAPSMAFFVLTAVLLGRQFLLLDELRESHQTLETRVRERTRDLETMQAAIIRTERMNLAATLGAGLAHNLNNALTVVLATSDALQDQVGNGPEAEAVADVVAAARQAAELSGRLMRFARQAREETPTSVDLREAAKEIEGLLRVYVGRDIKLTMDLEPAETTVVSTRSRFEQILVNLVSNARDVLPEGGSIEVKVTHVASGGVDLCVADNGPGITDDLKGHLFEPFFTTKTDGKGTGLGLVSVKAMAEQDGGSVTVDSRPGAGTAFHVTWPSANHPAAHGHG
jgi:signal transduction histidine kinase